jgi:hypothetical protein
MTAQLTHDGTRARTTVMVTPAIGRRLRGAFHRIRFTIREMNYASRRVVELQAPWAVDTQWHRK